MVGERLGSYRVLRKLGEGGMGVVYVGEHAELGHPVAIKLLLPELSQDPEVVQRFFNEARAATRVRNPGIVQVHDFGHHPSGSAYFVMELLEGQSLAARIRERPTAPAQAAALIRQASNTLMAAHAQGIVHRDLKPDNIYLTPDAEVPGGERAKILDFGIAKLADETQGISLKTRTGTVMGTPYYMSPEQCRGAGGVDHRSDIYSLGCILYEMVCGRPPFLGAGAGEILGMHQFVAAVPARTLNPALSPGLDALIMRMLAKSPDQRPQSMAEVSRALEPFLPAGAGPSAQMVAFAPTAAPGATPRTTLGGAAGQLGAPAAAGKGKWIALVAALGVAGLGVGLWQAGVFGHKGGGDGGGTPAGAIAAATSPAPTPAVAQTPAVAPIPVAPTPAPAPVAPTPAPAPAAVAPTPAPAPAAAAPTPAPAPAPTATVSTSVLPKVKKHGAAMLGAPSGDAPGLVNAIIKRHMSSIKYCYEKQLIKNPDLAGKVTVNFTISGTGSVLSASASGLDPAVAGCVVGVIQRIEFPKPAGGGITNVSYPFVFAATGSGGSSSPTPSKPPDEVACLIDPSQPGCKKAARASSGEPGNERLDQGALVAGMSPVKGRAEACFDQYKVPGIAKVRVTVSSAGSVTSAQTEGAFAGTPTGSCLERAVRAAHFRSFTGSPMTFKYPFVLR